MKNNQATKILIFINVVVAVLIAMNLTEMMSRLVKVAHIGVSSDYTYTEHYNVRMQFNSKDEMDRKQAYQTMDNLLCDMAVLPVNAYISSIGGMIDNGDNVFYTIYISMKEPLPYTLESGSYDKINQPGVYIGNRHEWLIKDNCVSVFREKLPVSGIMEGIGFNKNGDVIVKYGDLDKEYRCEEVCEWVHSVSDEKMEIRIRINLGSRQTEMKYASKEFEKIVDRYPNVSYEKLNLTIDESKMGSNTMDKMAGEFKRVLYIVAVLFCVISSVYVINLYLSQKKKDIAISYALGLGKRITFFMIVKEVGPAFLGGVCTSFVLEIIVYTALRGYAVGTVLLYGVCGAFCVMALYLVIIFITFMKIFRKGIVRELGGE